MAQRRHHYERAFEEFLRSRRIPYVAVDEARKTLVPEPAPTPGAGEGTSPGSLKSFDFVIYGQVGGAGGNLLVDIKGRRVAPRTHRSPGRGGRGGWGGRLESWVTADDVDSLAAWERLFGPGFAAAFVFVYRCDAQPPDALFQEVLEYQGAWYALRAVMLDRYHACMKVRSPRWRTVDIPAAAFERISQPFAPFRTDDPRGPGEIGRAGDPAWTDAGPDLPALAPLGGAGYHHA